MNQSELIAACAQELGMTKAKVKEVLEIIGNVILKNVEKHESVAFPVLGRFSRKVTKERSCRNPRSKELMKVPPKPKLVFAASSSVKEFLQRKK